AQTDPNSDDQANSEESLADGNDDSENSDEIVFVSNIREACVGVEVNFELTKGEVEGSYLWNFGDGDFSSQANPSHSYDDPGVYDITLSVRSEEDGQIRSKTVKNFMAINPNPQAAFDWEFVNDPSDAPTVRFINTSERANEAEWSFDDKDYSKEINPEVTYVSGGKHKVVLTVANDYGCVDETVSYIFIDEDYKLNAVKSFTPNGDGKNDTFIPEALINSNQEFKMTIYDNKQPIFESTSNRNPWDGSIDGSVAPAGSYPWVVIIYNNRGEEERYFSGTITITP
ncbi:MAG: PKD domain-containing protein, partial [Flavobacteriales bacterium]|nr:PKD domain-containing protein [Flavobacteriales bacterium]